MYLWAAKENILQDIGGFHRLDSMWPETFPEIGEETEEREARATGPSDGNHREDQLHKWSNLKGATLILVATN
jgi:hypothetical protein